jgi:hypothetical protein
MIRIPASWRIRKRRAAALLIAGALPLACAQAVHAQGIMRSPNINIGGDRMPNINAMRVNPNIAGSAADRASPRIRSDCSYAYRDSSGECRDQPVSSAGGGGSASGKKGNNVQRRDVTQALNLRPVANELVAEIDGTLTDAQTDELARRHGLRRIGSQNFPLIGATIGLFRITNRRAADVVSRELAADAGVRSVQPNFRYAMQDQNAALTEGDPAQYALAKLRLPEAHQLAHGTNVIVAVIDSGIDIKHPELAGSIAASFDALDSKEGPHFHGTGIAGVIVAHARLMGSAPAARLLAIRAFSGAPGGAESTSYVILKGLDYAAAHRAQIVNMSFAGPKDPLIERGIAATAARGIVMVAAAGNEGAKSPPLYPAANPNVIAVSATDAQDKLFTASNRGGYVAIAAPGVDIFLPSPDEKYQMRSGTSFSAAYISGLAALMLERNPSLKAAEVRAILMKTARDLGAPGRDDLFGAGEADAFAAVTAVIGAPGVPVAAVPDASAAQKPSDRRDVPSTRSLDEPVAAIASDKAPGSDASRPAAQ